MDEFEKQVLASLCRLLNGRPVAALGIAVSGGADSVSLLVAAKNLVDAGCLSVRLFCVTVDHSIRPENESAGDAAFVQGLCKSLGVDCTVKKIERGLVQKTEAERARGPEEAARFLRYKAFEDFAKEKCVDFILTAHNQNDLVETVLMRFLQGGGSASLQGIQEKRGIYLRPLLSIPRSEIEAYLARKNIFWRTDATNQNNKFLRNKIRNELVPFLDQNFEGWKGAVLAASVKAGEENAALEKMAESFSLQKEGGDGFVFLDSKIRLLPMAARERVFFRALNELGLEDRVPFDLVQKISGWPEVDFKRLSFLGVEAWTKNQNLFLKKSAKQATESGFFDIIYRKGKYVFQDFSFEVKENPDGTTDLFFCGKNSSELKRVGLPFVVRSAAPGDRILTSGGQGKSLSDVLSDWKALPLEKNKIPVVECKGKIIAFLGGLFSYKDWIVK